MKYLLTVLTMTIVMAGSLFAQDAGTLPPPPEDAPFWVLLVGKLVGAIPEVNMWLAAVLGLFMGLCRAVAEFLAWLAPRTDWEGDNRALAFLRWAMLWISAVIGWFGLGSPKQLSKKQGSDG